MEDLLDLSFTESPAAQQQQQQRKPPIGMPASTAPISLAPTRPTSAASVSAATYSALRPSSAEGAQKSKSKPAAGSDSFASLVSFSSSKSRDAANRPLNERVKAPQLAAFGTSSSSSTTTTAAGDTDWASGLSFDLLESAGAGNGQANNTTPPSATSTSAAPLLDDEDDILGALARPVEASKPAPPARQQPSAAAPSRSTPSTRTSSSSSNSFPTSSHSARPTSSSSARPSPPPSRFTDSPAPADDRSSANSTPPAASEVNDSYVAELVDMGFAASAARKALAQTDTGNNVPQAVDILIREAHEKAKRLHHQRRAGGEPESEEPRAQRQSARPPPRQRPSRFDDVEHDDVLAPHPSDRVRRTRPSRFDDVEHDDVLAPHPSERARRTHTNDDEDDEWQSMPSVYSDGTSSSNGSRRSRPSSASQNSTQDLGKLASVFSAQLRSRAEVLWKQGKETVAKAVEEYQQHTNGTGAATGGNFADESSPRWMQRQQQQRYKFDDDATEISFEEPTPDNRTRRGGQLASTLEAQLLEQQGPPPPPQPPRPRASATHSSSSSRTQTSRFEDDAPAMPARPRQNQFEDMEQYAPSNRRRARPPPATTRSSSSSTSAAAPPPPQRKQAPAPAPPKPRPKPPARPQIPISSIQLDDLTLSRTEGTDAFKRGDFTLANELYTKALEVTPEQHLLRAVLLSNRAASLLKLGNTKPALTDADDGLAIIGPGKGIDEEYEPGKKLVDIWAKLVQRKAEALEQLEKYKEAKDAWEELVQSGKGGAVAMDGRRRCDAVINPTPKSSAPSSGSSTPKPQAQRPRPKPTTIEDSAAAQAALKKMKEENRKLEAEDAEKFALLDGVEAKIAAWKHGKEENLRALLGSLDSILWREAGWVKVSMADLVLPKKVKINYMKAVAKTHPDKVPASATTEQKMIAQAVFVSLNHAWDEFKKQNNIQ